MWIEKRRITVSRPRWVVDRKGLVFAYILQNKICIEVEGKLHEQEVEVELLADLKLHKDILIIFEDSYITYGLSLADFKKINFEFERKESFYMPQSFDNEIILIYKRHSLIQKDIGIYSFETKEKRYFTEKVVPIIIDGILFSTYMGKITRCQWNGETQWSLDISKIGYFKHPHENRRDKIRVEQFVGVYEQVLWVYLGNMVFLGIDVDSGEVLYKMDQVTTHVNTDYFPDMDADLLALIWDARWFLDKKSGLIKGLCNHCYIEIDLKKPAKESNGLISRLFNKKDSVDIYPDISVRHFYSKIRELGFRNISGRNTIIDTDFKNIFFPSEEYIWGVYNTQSYTFDYISEAVTSGDSDSFVRLREIQQGGDKVYVLDQENTVHIYEKE